MESKDCKTQDGWERDVGLSALFEPGAADAAATWSDLTDGQREELRRIELRLSSREDRMERYEASMLRDADQLPHIDSETFRLTWDVQAPVMGEVDVVILHGHTEVWRELASWEDHVRFGLVAGILKDRYGPRLEDLEPTRRAEVVLYGSNLGALHYVDAIRRDLRQNART